MSALSTPSPRPPRAGPGVVRRGARVTAVAGVDVVVHESRRFAPTDVRVVAGMPATSVPRSALDAAVWARDPREAARIVVAAVQQRRVRPIAVRAELDAAGAVRHRKLPAALLDDLAGGAQALSEVEFLAFCRRHGLPRPTLQHRTDDPLAVGQLRRALQLSA